MTRKKLLVLNFQDLQKERGYHCKNYAAIEIGLANKILLDGDEELLQICLL
jgi:hypothetical protein